MRLIGGDNRQARWTRFEPLFESGRAGVFHAEGRWTAGDGGSHDQSRDREGAASADDAGHEVLSLVLRD